jgi:hypothetical protein
MQSPVASSSQFQDTLELAKGAHYTIVLDEHLRTNHTVVKIAGAVKRSQLASRKGNFMLSIRDDGSFHLRQLP